MGCLSLVMHLEIIPSTMIKKLELSVIESLYGCYLTNGGLLYFNSSFISTIDLLFSKVSFTLKFLYHS